MLATGGRPLGDLGGWVVEPKLDGWRAIVSVEDGQLSVRTRNGRSITQCVPELGPLDDTGDVVLDGELIVGAGRLDDFARLSGRLAGRPREGAETVAFVAFDVLWHDGHALTGRPHHERREVLAALDLSPAHLIPSFAGSTADDLLAACEQHGMEGVVLKRSASPYQPGARSKDWRKLKCPAWREHLERRVSARR
jgi:bifunctional non-homologous end joining protein LigD